MNGNELQNITAAKWRKNQLKIAFHEVKCGSEHRR